MNQWLVYQTDGSHVGPVSTELLARGLAAGRVPRDAQVGLVGTVEQRPVLSVDEISGALAALDAALAAPDDDGPTGLTRIKQEPLEPCEALPSATDEHRPIPDAPASEADATEVIRRDAVLSAALDRVRAASVAPPKPPRAPSVAPPPPPIAPRVPSGSMSAVAPSKPAVPSAPLMAAAPPAPNTQTMLQPEPQPPMQAPPPPMAMAIGAPFAPSAPVPLPPSPPALQGVVPVGPPVDVKPEAAAKEEPKTPVVDPKLALLLPAGIFGVFVVIALVLVVVAAIIKPKVRSAESPTADSTSTAR